MQHSISPKFIQTIDREKERETNDMIQYLLTKINRTLKALNSFLNHTHK